MTEEQISPQQTLEQERAVNAWDKVDKVSANLRAKYGTQARRLASLIQINGLGQTAAFLYSKHDDQAMKTIYQHLSSWVTRRMDEPGDSDLLECITKWSSDTYRRAMTEALAYALWLRRFVEGKGWGQEEGGD